MVKDNPNLNLVVHMRGLGKESMVPLQLVMTTLGMDRIYEADYLHQLVSRQICLEIIHISKASKYPRKWSSCGPTVGGGHELISEQATWSLSGSLMTPFSVNICNNFAKNAGNSWFERQTKDFWLKRRLVVLSYSCLKHTVPYNVSALP